MNCCTHWSFKVIPTMCLDHCGKHLYSPHPSIMLTHWGRVTHICVSKLTTIGSDNGLSPGRHQAIICTNAGILLIRPSGTTFREMLIEIVTFSFMKMRLKVSSAKWRPFCLGLNVLNKHQLLLHCSLGDICSDVISAIWFLYKEHPGYGLSQWEITW